MNATILGRELIAVDRCTYRGHMTTTPVASSSERSGEDFAAPIHGWGKVALLNLRCWVVLAALNVVPALVIALAPGGTVTGNLILLSMALLVAGVLILTVGYPAGVLTAHLLRRNTSERAHVLTFAAVGAALSTAILLVFLSDSIGYGVELIELIFLGVAATEGALGAGLARLWSGRTHWRRRQMSETPPARFDASDKGVTEPGF